MEDEEGMMSVDGEEEKEEEDEGEWPEQMRIYMPSALGKQQCVEHGCEVMVEQEIELRIGQADDGLEKLRLALGHKSLLLRTEVRNSQSQRTSTRAWAQVHHLDAKVRKHVRCYHRARHALQSLDANATILERLRPIESDDLKMSGDVVEENRVGQRSDTLAWFWRLEGTGDNQDDSWMNECE